MFKKTTSKAFAILLSFFIAPQTFANHDTSSTSNSSNIEVNQENNATITNNVTVDSNTSNNSGFTDITTGDVTNNNDITSKVIHMRMQHLVCKIMKESLKLDLFVNREFVNLIYIK